jgi:hypothetical protein
MYLIKLLRSIYIVLYYVLAICCLTHALLHMYYTDGNHIHGM